MANARKVKQTQVLLVFFLDFTGTIRKAAIPQGHNDNIPETFLGRWAKAGFARLDEHFIPWANFAGAMLANTEDLDNGPETV